MGRLTPYHKQRIINLKCRKGYKWDKIQRILRVDDGLQISTRTLKRFWKQFCETGSLARKTGSGRKSKIGPQHFDAIDEEMRQNKELDSEQLVLKMEERFGIRWSASTLRRVRKRLGWKHKGTKYCQMIRDNNKKKRLDFCVKLLATQETYDNVIFVDETKIEMDCHMKMCFVKDGEAPHDFMKPKAKHPYKVNGWGGISKRGATPLHLFTGNMDSVYYQSILSDCFLPFAEEAYPEGPRLWQDNDPKHTSRTTRTYLLEKGIQWWQTPAESPDLNPIENLWGAMKAHIRKHIKPQTKEQLVQGIEEYWGTVTPDVCKRFIRHLQKVVPMVILREGKASGY